MDEILPMDEVPQCRECGDTLPENAEEGDLCSLCKWANDIVSDEELLEGSKVSA